MKFGTETEFTNALLAELKKIPRTKWWRNNTGRRAGVSFGQVGAPDILGIVRWGRLVGIECKTDSGDVSDVQQRWHDEAITLGAKIIVARPSSFAQVLLEVFEASE